MVSLRTVGLLASDTASSSLATAASSVLTSVWRITELASLSSFLSSSVSLIG